MTKEKQIIKEMTKQCHFCEKGKCFLLGDEAVDCDMECDIGEFAKSLYNVGYRKQSEGEWIRYPHGSGIYCSLCKHKRRYRDINDAFCPNCGASMKGGAE